MRQAKSSAFPPSKSPTAPGLSSRARSGRSPFIFPGTNRRLVSPERRNVPEFQNDGATLQKRRHRLGERQRNGKSGVPNVRIQSFTQDNSLFSPLYLNRSPINYKITNRLDFPPIPDTCMRRPGQFPFSSRFEPRLRQLFFPTAERTTVD